MKILAINPNTTEEFNVDMDRVAKQYALPGTEVTVISPDEGPKSVEGSFDEALSVLSTVKVFSKFQQEYDAFIIACYSDPLSADALREITTKPVIGIAEASMQVAPLLGYKFSVVSTNERWKPLLESAVEKYGVKTRCASVRTTGLTPLDLEKRSEREVKTIIRKEALKAIEEDGAEVICLGCAGMAGFDKELEEELEVPVLDGFVCAIKVLEFFHQYGVSHSKRNRYKVPFSKQIIGSDSNLGIYYQEK